MACRLWQRKLRARTSCIMHRSFLRSFVNEKKIENKRAASVIKSYKFVLTVSGVVRCDDSRLKDIYHIQQLCFFVQNIRTFKLASYRTLASLTESTTCAQNYFSFPECQFRNRYRKAIKWESFESSTISAVRCLGIYLGASDKVFIFEFNPLVDTLSSHNSILRIFYYY